MTAAFEQRVKIGKNLLRIPAGHPMPAYRVRWSSFDRPLMLIADALAAQDRLHGAIDIGANVGDSLAQICHCSNVPVLCVEPDDTYHASLLQNIEAIGSGTAVQALIAESGTDLQHQQLVSAAGTARLVQGSAGTTPALSLDELLDRHPAFYGAELLKVDTDGYDLDVLRSGWRWISAQQPALFFEFDMTFGRATLDDGHNALKQLVGIGYRYFLFFDNFGHLAYDLDLQRDSFDTALRYLRSNVTHGKVVHYFDIAALAPADANTRAALISSYEQRLQDAAAQRIAVLRLDNLGDHVLNSGLWRPLRTAHPTASITAIVPVSVADLYARCPYIDNLIALPSREAYLTNQDSRRALLDHLGSFGGFDLVLNPRFGEDYYLAGFLSTALARPGAPKLAFRQSRTPYENYDANAYYTKLVDAPETLHASSYVPPMLAAAGIDAASVGACETWYDAEDLRAIRERLELNTPYLVVGCGASFPFKMPPEDIYAALGEALAKRHGYRIVVIGDAQEAATAAALTSGLGDPTRAINALGVLPLPQLAALLAQAALFIGPDAGPKHMAAAAGTPVLELGWVPDDYPDISRGPHTAGRPWTPAGCRSISLTPDPKLFWMRRNTPEFMHQRIAGLNPTLLSTCISQLLDAPVEQ